MKKILVFAVAILTATTIFAQEKKAVIGVAELTTTLSNATVSGHWGEYWGSPDAKDAANYTTVETPHNTEVKEPAVIPATLPQVMQSLKYLIFDYFKDSDLFEVVECNSSGSNAKDIDYLVQPSLDMLTLERGIYKFLGSSVTVQDHCIVGVNLILKDVKNNRTYPPMTFFAGSGDVHKSILEKVKERGAYVDIRGVPNRELTGNVTREEAKKAHSTGGFLSKALDAALTKEKPKDFFLYEDDSKLYGLERLVRNIIIAVYHTINPPMVQAVDENGIITFPALGFNEKDMLDVINGGERVAEIFVYNIEDRIAYAKVDPVDPEFADAEIQEGFYIYPAEREWKWAQVNTAIKNIKKEVKAIEKAKKGKAKAKK